MTALSPRYSPSNAKSSSAAVSVSATTGANVLPSSMRRSPSCEWREWEETLDNFSTGLDVADLDGLDQFLLATADDFIEPFTGLNATPDSPICAPDQDIFYENEQDLETLLHTEFNMYSCSRGEPQHFKENKQDLQLLVQQQIPMLSTAKATSAVHRHRKRKTGELYRFQDEAERLTDATLHVEKKAKRLEERTSVASACMKNKIRTNEQMEKVYRRRYDILYGILETWNTGGIEDMEEIADNVYADDVTLISPDNSQSLHGVEAVMSHWSLLLDAFPDGIMEEYIIQREEGSSDRMKATWIFSGTQTFPIFGVQPRHKKVTISGKSFFTFKGDRIWRIVLSWNYRETLLKLMGD